MAKVWYIDCGDHSWVCSSKILVNKLLQAPKNSVIFEYEIYWMYMYMPKIYMWNITGIEKRVIICINMNSELQNFDILKYLIINIVANID